MDGAISAFTASTAGALLGQFDQADGVQAPKVPAGQGMGDAQLTGEFGSGHRLGPHEREHPQPHGMGKRSEDGVCGGHATK